MKAVISIFTRATTALFSGKKAAYVGIVLKLLRPFTLLFDNTEKRNDQLPPILFIVSPPRSGSTVFYQVCTRIIDCIYFSNLHFLFPQKGSKLLFEKKWFNKSAATGFDNYYGYSPAMNDVNEGNEVFDQLFDLEDQNELRKQFLDYIHSFKLNGDKPIIFKNVRNYKNIEKIKRSLPEVSFIRVKRDLSLNIQSELIAHYDLKTFHPIPKELENVDYTKDPVRFACRQITSVYKSIDDQLKGIEPERDYVINYEQLCAEPSLVMAGLCNHFEISSFLDDKKLSNIHLRASMKQKVSDEEMSIINEFLDQKVERA